MSQRYPGYLGNPPGDDQYTPPQRQSIYPQYPAVYNQQAYFDQYGAPLPAEISPHQGPPPGAFPPQVGLSMPRPRPDLSIPIPPLLPGPQTAGGQLSPMPFNYLPNPQQISPYSDPDYDAPPPFDSASTNSATMTEYFPSMPGQSTMASPVIGMQAPAPQSWSTGPTPPKGKGRTPGSGPKTSRTQFSSCGACRHRRVKCDLKDRQEQAEREALAASRGGGPSRVPNLKKVSCTNCLERGMNCVDEYAPIKAAKQLRRGKRISEIENIYGKQGPGGSSAKSESLTTASSSPKGKEKVVSIPHLTPGFFESPFFRRLQIQRPIIDPVEFVERIFARGKPTADNIGIEALILCHVLYAWGLSFGVDETGRMDVSDGGGVPSEALPLMDASPTERQRDADRQRRRQRVEPVGHFILSEVDQYGLLRRAGWDGVRAMILFLQLPTNVMNPAERIAFNDIAMSRVYTLCSSSALDYAGNSTKALGMRPEINPDGIDIFQTRARTYWYSFVHEGVVIALQGGRTHLDDEDRDSMQGSIQDRSVTILNDNLKSVARFATTPINLSMACRLINKTLMGAAARRRGAVDSQPIKQAWEALERCWEDFEALGQISPGPFRTSEEMVRIAQGWKILAYKPYCVIRDSLEARLRDITSGGASIQDSNSARPNASQEALNLSRLLDIARQKCETKERACMEILRRQVGSTFFEWDALLVRDAVFTLAQSLVAQGGSDTDISICLQAMDDMRWAYSDSAERIALIRRTWAETRGIPLASTTAFPVQSWNNPSESPPTSSSTSRLSMSSMPNVPPFSAAASTGTTGPSTMFASPEGSPDLVSSAHFYPYAGAQGPTSDGREMSEKWMPTDNFRGQTQVPYPVYHEHGLPGMAPASVPASFGVENPGPGQVVLQPDGTQVFVPFHGMP